MPEFESNLETRFERGPHQREVEVDLEGCLRALVNEANGKKLHGQLDSYLIRQLNASYIEDKDDRNFTCLVEDCEVGCILRTTGEGNLELIRNVGIGNCKQNK
ncbi:hypothetical protein BH10PAT1_BH10PAT1_2730 [soil metagenome]